MLAIVKETKHVNEFEERKETHLIGLHTFTTLKYYYNALYLCQARIITVQNLYTQYLTSSIIVLQYDSRVKFLFKS